MKKKLVYNWYRMCDRLMSLEIITDGIVEIEFHIYSEYRLPFKYILFAI